MQFNFFNFASFVGGLVLFRFTLSLCGGIYASFLRPAKNVKRFGKWAVVTGATDGIGRAFCFELARRGMNLLMISRTQQKLSDVAQEIKDLYQRNGCEIRTVPIDFSLFNSEARQKVKNGIEGLDIGVLINNVGLSYPFPHYFMELDDEYVQQLIDLNIISTTFMTRIVLPGMVKRKKGAIVNISSASARAPMPLLSGYSAAKSYIEMLSQGLDAEYSAKGVHVQCQTPLFVTSKLSKIRKESFFVCSPKAYAAAGVNHIGYESLTTPYWTHKLQLFVLGALPKFVVSWYMMKLHAPLRRRGIKKQMDKERASKSK